MSESERGHASREMPCGAIRVGSPLLALGLAGVGMEGKEGHEAGPGVHLSLFSSLCSPSSPKGNQPAHLFSGVKCKNGEGCNGRHCILRRCNPGDEPNAAVSTVGQRLREFYPDPLRCLPVPGLSPFPFHCTASSGSIAHQRGGPADANVIERAVTRSHPPPSLDPSPSIPGPWSISLPSAWRTIDGGRRHSSASARAAGRHGPACRMVVWPGVCSGTLVGVRAGAATGSLGLDWDKLLPLLLSRGGMA